jgi:hypothetical protein
LLSSFFLLSVLTFFLFFVSLLASMILVHVFQAFDPLKDPSFTYPTLMPTLHMKLFLIGSPMR